jgi:hypothetical protein
MREDTKQVIFTGSGVSYLVTTSTALPGEEGAVSVCSPSFHENRNRSQHSVHKLLSFIAFVLVLSKWYSSLNNSEIPREKSSKVVTAFMRIGKRNNKPRIRKIRHVRNKMP